MLVQWKTHYQQLFVNKNVTQRNDYLCGREWVNERKRKKQSNDKNMVKLNGNARSQLNGFLKKYITEYKNVTLEEKNVAKDVAYLCIRFCNQFLTSYIILKVLGLKSILKFVCIKIE